MPGLIVHEWLEPTGGAERVVDGFVEAFPNAEVGVLWDDDPHRYGERRVRESWMARTPLRRHKALALPFMVPTWRCYPPGRPEWAIVSSHLFAHHVNVRGAPKLVYAHTPARYIWEPQLDTRGNSLAVRAASRLIQPLDRKRIREARSVAANSFFTKDRIRRTWDIDAAVIYPPVDTVSMRSVTDWLAPLTEHERYVLGKIPTPFILGASRMVAYKRLDRVIDVGSAAEIPVVIAGSGPDRGRLGAHAAGSGASVTFLDRPSDVLLHALYAAATAFVFPAVEDFGIMPVEAMACGTPVIANCVGGAAESVALCGGGITVDFEATTDWGSVLDRIGEIDTEAMRNKTAVLDRSEFVQRVRSWVGAEIQSYEYE